MANEQEIKGADICTDDNETAFWHDRVPLQNQQTGRRNNEGFTNGQIIGCDFVLKSKNDPVNHPQHYTSHPSGIECIEITRHMGFNLGNTVKYIWRDGLKDTEVPLQDLKKAMWYLQDEIMMREERDK